MSKKLTYIPTDTLVKNMFQPRNAFDDTALDSLAQSIKEVGLLHPPVVRETADNTFEIIAGERRVRACKKLGLHTIPVLIVSSSNEQAAKAALIENIHRVDLNPIEIAQAIQTLIQTFKIRQEDVAKKIGKDRSTITNYLRLLKLSKTIQEHIKYGALSTAHAKALLSCTCPLLQEKICAKILEEKLSVKATNTLVQKAKKTSRGQDNLFLKEVEGRLEEALGTKVVVNQRGQKGVLSIHYFSLDDLERVLDLLAAKN